MIPNFYFPCQIPYFQTSVAQTMFNQMFYPQFYQGECINSLNFFQNSPLQNMETQANQNYSFKETLNEQKQQKLQIVTEQEKQQNKFEENQELKMLQMKTRQKYGRNITSNIFRSLVKRISSQNGFKKIALRIIQQKKYSITYGNFIEQINLLTMNIGSYIKKNEMKSFILPRRNNKRSQQFCAIFRILSKIYLRQQHTLNVYYSKKINKDSRSLHFVLARQMEQMLKQIKIPLQ